MTETEKKNQTGAETEIPTVEDDYPIDIDRLGNNIDEPVSSEQKSLCRYPDYSKKERDVDSDGFPARGEGAEGVERDVWDALYDVEDPEMPVSIVDLGLVYGVNVETDTETDEGDVEEDGETTAEIDMTLTYTGCPARDMLLNEVRGKVGEVEGVDNVDVGLVFTPSWSIDMVSEKGKENLREFGLSV